MEKSGLMWRPIKGFEGLYWISAEGSVKNKRGKILTPTLLPDGMRVVGLYGNGQREQKPVKTLMIESFPELFEEEENER